MSKQQNRAEPQKEELSLGNEQAALGKEQASLGRSRLPNTNRENGRLARTNIY
jgi:hypothetical protein